VETAWLERTPALRRRRSSPPGTPHAGSTAGSRHRATFGAAAVTAPMNGPMEMHAELTTQKSLDHATAKGGPAIYTLTISRLAGIASTVQHAWADAEVAFQLLLLPEAE
jgi:hypothetical protein